MAIFGALIIVLNLITFASTRERVQPPPGDRHPLSDDLKDVLTCRPWLVMFILTLLVFTMLVVRGSSSNYFFAYYLDQQSVRDFLGTVGLAGLGGEPTAGRPRSTARPACEAGQFERRRRGTEPVLRGGSLVQIVGIMFSKPLADRFGKKAVFLVGVSVTTAATLAVFLVGRPQWACSSGWASCGPSVGPTVRCCG